IQKACVDDPTQDATATVRPERLDVTLSRENLYNAKPFVIAEKDLGGRWSYYIRNRTNQVVYHINPRGYVTYTTYTPSEKPETITRLANKTTLGLSAYAGRAITR